MLALLSLATETILEDLVGYDKGCTYGLAVDDITNTARGIFDFFIPSGEEEGVFEVKYPVQPALKPDDAVKQDIYEQYVEMLMANGISAKEAEQAVADAILNNEFEATKGKEVAVAAAIPLIYEGVAFISAAILSKMVGDELAKKYSGLGGDFKDSLEEINSDISEKETSEYYKKQYEKGKSSAIKSKVTTAASSGGMPDPDDDEQQKERKFNVHKSESKIWKEFQHYKGKTKTNGLSGNKREYYQWDHTHNDIEVYDSNMRHLGSKDPQSGKIIKGPVTGRKINTW